MGISKSLRSLQALLSTRPGLSRCFSSTPRHHKPAARREVQGTQTLEALKPQEPSRSERRLGILESISTKIQSPRNTHDGSSGARSDLSRFEQAKRSRSVEKQQHRPWREGDVYAPHDLSSEEMKKWNRSRRPTVDVFDTLNINPLDEYKNLPLMLDFMTDMGRIKHQKETGLRPVNQRKIAKAIRRSICIGFLPRVHAHPEMLRRPGRWSRQG